MHLLAREEGIPGQTRSLRAVRVLTVGGVTGGIVAALATFAGLYLYATISISQFDYATVAEASRNAATVEQAFHDLADIDLPHCSPEHLAAMRAIVFRNPSVRDAAYRLDDDTLCSSGLGLITAPRHEFGQPSFVGEDGTEVWLRRTIPAAPGLVSTIVARSGYSLLVAPAQHPTSTPFGAVLSTVLVNRATGVTLTFQGPTVSYAAAQFVNGAHFHDGARSVAVGCVVTGLLCYVQTVTPGEVLRAQAVPYSLVVALGISVGALAGLLIAILRLRRELLPNRLRAAIAAGQLTLAYQPTVEISSGRIVGAEALMRWTLPDGQTEDPTEFIAAAEASSLITEVDCLAVEIAARELGELLKARPDLVLSINIVARDLTDDRFFAALDRHFIGAGVPTASIAFELTERQAITSEPVISATRRLHSAGFRLYLDDFGMGYSSIGCLDKLPVDAIKLDKLFTQGVVIDPIRSRLTATILEMGSDLNLPVIVEGVELATQEAYFRAAGVSLAQGWLYSGALTAAEFTARVAEPPRQESAPA